ncbi:MAG: hypothetical protein CM1200mP27_12200 [Chloroflexota bacterium]|nr:MAG: hypothetical protein CM1200mP27_12200 [Chloroflexota bacterium]
MVNRLGYQYTTEQHYAVQHPQMGAEIPSMPRDSLIPKRDQVAKLASEVLVTTLAIVISGKNHQRQNQRHPAMNMAKYQDSLPSPPGINIIDNAPTRGTNTNRSKASGRSRSTKLPSARQKFLGRPNPRPWPKCSYIRDPLHEL